jgi:hypothetical protein
LRRIRADGAIWRAVTPESFVFHPTLRCGNFRQGASIEASMEQ